MAKSIVNTNTALITSQELNLSSLLVPAVVMGIISDMKFLYPQKRKISADDFLIFIPRNCLPYEISDNIAKALLDADVDKGMEIWGNCAAPLQHAMVIPDRGTINRDIICKFNVEGKAVRNAYLSRVNYSSPRQSPYAAIYGDYTAEAATELVMILKDLEKVQPNGKELVDEFFEDIDLRILYLFAMHEAEQFAADDPDGGAYLQLAMQLDDEVPEGVPLLCWLQQSQPGIFTQLRGELMDPVWQENRSLFWEGWIRQNKPHLDNDSFEKKKFNQNHSLLKNSGEDMGSMFDDLMKVHEET